MTERMRPEIKAQWVEALRSGEYRQTTATLFDSRGFCCLGVLCELAAKAGIVAQGNGVFFSVADPDGDESSHELPRAVVEWAGLQALSPKERDGATSPGVQSTGLGLEDEPSTVSLAALNDSYDFNFNQIADIIEKEF